MASVEMLNTLALFHYYTRLAKTIDQIIKTSLKEPMYVCRASHSGLLLLVLERLRSVSMATPLLLIPFLTFTSRTQPPLSESPLEATTPLHCARPAASIWQEDIAGDETRKRRKNMALIPSQVLRVAILLSYFSILCNYKAIDMPAHQTYGGSWKFLTFIDLVSVILFSRPEPGHSEMLARHGMVCYRQSVSYLQLLIPPTLSCETGLLCY